jgi:hypothetical protein
MEWILGLSLEMRAASAGAAEGAEHARKSSDLQPLSN